MPPPDEADDFPTDAERAATVAWIESSLGEFDAQHAGEPGRITVRRLTSAEYAYAIHDLTGIDIKTGIDASSDSVGGEGFANFGDVQSCRTPPSSATSRPPSRSPTTPSSAPARSPSTPTPARPASSCRPSTASTTSTPRAGFRVVSGEGGRPFGFDRYGRRSTSRWYYKHRAALGDPPATLRGLAAKEGITGRFAEHIWDVVNRRAPAIRRRETIAAWQQLPAPRRRRRRRRPRHARTRRGPHQEADHLAQLVLRARRRRRRRRRRREPAGVRRLDADGQADAQLHLRR